MDDDFEPISAIVERLVNGLAPGRGEEGTQPGASHRAEGGGGATILQFRRRSGAAGPKRPPRQSAIDTVTDGGVALSQFTPATGGLGHARKREGA